MASIKINSEKCKGCLVCMRFCPKGLIKPSNKLNSFGFKAVEFKDAGTCLGCCQCALICPETCIEVYKE